MLKNKRIKWIHRFIGFNRIECIYGGKHLIHISLLTDGLLKYEETFDDFTKTQR